MICFAVGGQVGHFGRRAVGIDSARDGDADIIVQLKIRTAYNRIKIMSFPKLFQDRVSNYRYTKGCSSHTRVDGRIPLDDLLVSNLVLGLDRITLITRGHFVIFFAIFRNTRLGGRLAVVSGRRSRRGYCCARDVDANIVVQPDVGATFMRL